MSDTSQGRDRDDPVPVPHGDRVWRVARSGGGEHANLGPGKELMGSFADVHGLASMRRNATSVGVEERWRPGRRPHPGPRGLTSATEHHETGQDHGMRRLRSATNAPDPRCEPDAKLSSPVLDDLGGSDDDEGILSPHEDRGQRRSVHHPHLEGAVADDRPCQRFANAVSVVP